MNDTNITTLAQLREFTKLSNGAQSTKTNREEAYTWINEVLVRFRYLREIKKSKGMVKEYISTMT